MSEHDDDKSTPMPWFARGTHEPIDQISLVNWSLAARQNAFTKLQADLRFWRRTAQAALTILMLLWFYVFFV